MNNVCYLIPYYNCFDDLKISLISLKEGADVLIVDDGSEVALENIINLEDYEFDVKIIRMNSNSGIERALNEGLEYLRGRYTFVARLDCGDRCAKNRLKVQLTVLNDPEMVMVGSWANFVSEDYELIFISEMPSSDSDLRKKMYLNNVFIHPSVTMRLEAVFKSGKYPLNVPAAEDYALFFKMLDQGKVQNVQTPLIDYVVSSNSISSKKRYRQIRSRIMVLLANFSPRLLWGYGFFRALVTLLLPRSLTVFLRKYIRVY